MVWRVLIAILCCFSILFQHISAEINYNATKDETKYVYIISGREMLVDIDMIYKIPLVIYKI